MLLVDGESIIKKVKKSHIVLIDESRENNRSKILQNRRKKIKDTKY